jgi:hypothetical protein
VTVTSYGWVGGFRGGGCRRWLRRHPRLGGGNLRRVASMGDDVGGGG